MCTLISEFDKNANSIYECVTYLTLYKLVSQNPEFAFLASASVDAFLIANKYVGGRLSISANKNCGVKFLQKGFFYEKEIVINSFMLMHVFYT